MATTDKKARKDMADCLLSILDTLKLHDNDSLDTENETLSQMMFRKMKAYDIDLNQELGVDHLKPIIKDSISADPITEQEFCEVFEIKLKEGMNIPDEILNQYTRQIIGAYLLYEEFLNIKEKKFFNVDGTPLVAHLKDKKNFQGFVSTLGTRMKVEVSYLNDSGSSTPFWTYTKYENDEVVKMKNSAYRIFISEVLGELKSKYSSYGFSIEYRDYATDNYEGKRCHPNGKIWWDGLKFNTLFVKLSDKKFIELSSYRIIQSIVNRTGNFGGSVGPLKEPLARIAKSIQEQ